MASGDKTLPKMTVSQSGHRWPIGQCEGWTHVRHRGQWSSVTESRKQSEGFGLLTAE